MSNTSKRQDDKACMTDLTNVGSSDRLNASSLDAVQTVSVRQAIKRGVNKEVQNLLGAVRSIGRFSIGGLALGLLFLWIDDHFGLARREDAWHFLGFIGHIGTGLVVASIAVFAYEWQLHAREVIALTNNLNEAIDGITNVKEALEKERRDFDISRKHLSSRTGRKAVYKGLQGLLSTQNGAPDSRLRDNIMAIVDAISELKQHQNLETIQYLDVISWLIEEAVSTNAHALVELAKGNKRDFPYRVPDSAAVMTGRMLGAEMKVMEENDSYDSVSKLSFWEHDQLSYFFQKTEEALKRGVTVRRVFNLLEIDLSAYMEEGALVRKELHQLSKTVHKHEALAQRCKNQDYRGCYMIKFLSMPKQVRAVIDDTSRDEDYIRHASFGIFKRCNAKHVIRFEAEDGSPMLSRMLLGYRDADDPDCALFESIWLNSSSDSPFPDS